LRFGHTGSDDVLAATLFALGVSIVGLVRPAR